MLDLIASYVSDNFDIVFFGIITLIVLGAAILDIRDKNYPPGPLGVPFFGYIPLMNTKAPYLTLCELAQQYGRVFSVYFGSVYAVIVADAKLMREALNQEEFNKRAPLLVNHGLMKGNGISGAEGEKWQEHRNFVMRVFRDLGTPQGDGSGRKNVMETYIQQRVTEFVNDLKKSSVDGVDIAPTLTNNVGLVLTDMVLGKQFSKNDAEFKSIMETMEAASQVSSVSGAINYVPWIRNFSNAGNSLRAYKNGLERNHTIFQALLDKQVKTAGSANNNIRSVLEAYAMELFRRQGDEVGTFTTEQIQHVLSDLIGSGWETSATTLKWLYLYMAMYPDVQDNIVNEIKQVIDRGGQVTLKHFQDGLPYTQATIMEIWRHRSIIPLGIPRATHQDTKIGDHLIPKGSMIVPLLWAINHDTRLWEKPDIFCPERFLNEDGSLYRNENLYPFQCGNRVCIGDNIGKWIVELFFANTVNQLKISLPKGYHYNIENAPDCGLTLVPTPYQLHLESRH